MSKLTRQLTAILLSGMLILGSAPGSVHASSTDLDPNPASEIEQEVFAKESTEEESFNAPIPAEEEPVLDGETTEGGSSVSDEDAASDDSSVYEDGTSGDVVSPDTSEVSDPSEIGETTEESAEGADAADTSEVSDTSEDAGTAEEAAVGADASDDQYLIREFEDDVIVGFDKPGEADTISLEYKISLPGLREMFPAQLVIWLGGAVHYEEGDDGALVPVYAEGYTAKEIDVEWSCAEDYDESLELFHFVPVLEGYSLAEGIVLPEIIVQVEGEFEAPPLTEFEETDYDDFEVPILGAVETDGSPILRGTFPVKYDAYAENKLPVVRNQRPYGTCWAHGVIGAIEADLIADGNAGTDIDLSELHLAYFMSNEYYDEKNCNVGDTITTEGSFLKGGNERTSCNLLTSMVGPALETDVPYSLGDSYTPDPADGRALGAVQLTGVYEINSRDFDAVKNAILLHGGVSASYNNAADYYSSTYNSYYNPKEVDLNHAVMLVGWDDSFPRSSFRSGEPEKDGAWLVRNSWGFDGYDHTGYFWISYYDKSLYHTVLAMDVQTSRYDHCYAYDSIPFIAKYISKAGVISGTQTFTVDGQEQIEAVGIQTLNSELEVDISLECGKKSVSTSTSTGYPGCYLIPLDTPLTVARRSEVTLTVTYRGDGYVFLPVECRADNEIYGSVYHPNCGSGGMILKTEDEEFRTSQDSCFRLFTMDASAPISISELEVSLSQDSYVYDGDEKKPAVTVKDGSTLLEEGVDYSVDYRDNVNTGTAAVILTGTGRYEGTREETFTISRAVPSLLFAQGEMRKTLIDAAFINELSAITDGEVTFSSSNPAAAAVDASTGLVTIKGLGTAVITAVAEACQNYEAGTASFTLTVTAADISSFTAALSETSFTYDGTNKKPALTLRNDDTTLENGRDYVVVYENNIDPGTAKANAYGIGSCTGKLTLTFEIKAYSLKNAVISGIQSKTYSGKAQTQTPVVKAGSTLLNVGTDYTISFKNNVNAGKASMTITGKGNYTGSVTKEFKINKAAQSITAKAGASSIAVEKTTAVSMTGNKGSKSFKSSDTTIAIVDKSTGKVTARKVGTVRITATSAATSNYNAASKTVTIKVVPAATASLTAENRVNGIILTWKKVTGANGYKVYRGPTLIKTITNGTTVTYADATAKINGAKYTYKVVAKAATGDSTLSRSRVIYRVARPAVSSVTNIAASKITVKWGKNVKANGYVIQYSTDKTFKSGSKSVTAASASAVSRVIAGLTRGKTCYVRIRTYKTVGSARYWSMWSAAKSVRISK